MSEPNFQVFQCTNPDCGMRFSTDLSVNHFEKCPSCNSQMKKINEPYTNFQPAHDNFRNMGTGITLVLDNLRSTLNVGSIFRTAEGAGVKTIYCCGTTPTPDHPKIMKTSLGAEIQVAWSYSRNAVNLVANLSGTGNHCIALETTPTSISLFDLSETSPFLKKPLVLIIGNEISGVDPGILEISDTTTHIPMTGLKSSLNVAVSAGIALYTLKNLISKYSMLYTLNQGKIASVQEN
jgi:tRNA G18 (ribose-2'-O)-methylase SpoU